MSPLHRRRSDGCSHTRKKTSLNGQAWRLEISWRTDKPTRIRKAIYWIAPRKTWREISEEDRGIMHVSVQGAAVCRHHMFIWKGPQRRAILQYLLRDPLSLKLKTKWCSGPSLRSLRPCPEVSLGFWAGPVPSRPSFNCCPLKHVNPSSYEHCCLLVCAFSHLSHSICSFCKYLWKPWGKRCIKKGTREKNSLT